MCPGTTCTINIMGDLIPAQVLDFAAEIAGVISKFKMKIITFLLISAAHLTRFNSSPSGYKPIAPYHTAFTNITFCC